MPAPNHSKNPFRESFTEIPRDHSFMVSRLMKKPEDVVATLTPFKLGLLIAALRNVVKAGNALDVVKKHVFNGKPLPPDEYEIEQLPETFPDAIAKMGAAHCIVGIATEASELCEALLTFIDKGDLNLNNVIEELGDMEFYLCALRHNQMIPRNLTLQENLHKLLKGGRARYASGTYSDEQANARRDKAEEGDSKA